jgi:uncharacterized OsmC-like protein
VLTVAAVAAAKGIEPAKIEVQIDRTTNEGAVWETALSVQVDLGTGLTQREQIILFNSARHCEVHKLLGGAITVAYELGEMPGRRET